MQVSEIMHHGVSMAQINDSIKKVANLMKKEDVGALPIFKNERPVGFVTDRDIVISCVAQGASCDEPISKAMQSDIIFVYESDDINQATKLMKDNQISRLLVVDKGDRPVGMISIHDIARNLSDEHLTADLVAEIKR
ncbi:MAG: CBS domain-containing protein [Bacteriovoracaceae bacterium]